KRAVSHAAMVLQRSKRSATTPATGPRTREGSRRRTMAPEKAAPLAAGSSNRDWANPAVANRASQSPKEARPSTIHNRRNGRIFSTVFRSAVVFAMPLLNVRETAQGRLRGSARFGDGCATAPGVGRLLNLRDRAGRLRD